MVPCCRVECGGRMDNSVYDGNDCDCDGNTKNIDLPETVTNDRSSSIHVTPVTADDVDEIQRHLGGYGRYQVLVYVLLGLVYMRGGWNLWIPVLQAYVPGHHCEAGPSLDLNNSVPGYTENGEWVWDTCMQYVNYSINNNTEPCDRGWQYMWDKEGTSSIVSEYDLVCDQAYWVTLTSTLYMAGATCSVVALMPLADKFGSRNVMLVCLWLQAGVGTGIVWAGNVVIYSVCKFLIGLFNMTIALCAYVLMSETFPFSHRELPTIFMQLWWAAAIVTLAALGYLLPDWRDLQLAVALPINVASLAFVWILPNSLPWLLSKGRVLEARGVAWRIRQINGLGDSVDLNRMFDRFDINNKDAKPTHQTPDQNPEKVYTVMDLFKTPKMRTNSLLMFYLFLVNSLASFGIMFTSPQLAGDRFINLCLLGLVEIPAYAVCYFANRFIGRRKTICGFLAVCGVANIVVLLVPEETDDGTSLQWLQTTLVMTAKFAITGSYSTIYMYAMEVFPTVVRNQGVGASSLFENVGSLAAPSMVLVNDQVTNLPLGIFGGLTLVGAGLVLLLPETHLKPLPQTMEDVEDADQIRK